jgi:hypothetical protein
MQIQVFISKSALGLWRIMKILKVQCHKIMGHKVKVEVITSFFCAGLLKHVGIMKGATKKVANLAKKRLKMC